MSIFGRRPKAAPATPIDEFWQWWAQEGERGMMTAIKRGKFQKIGEAATARVDAMSSQLNWAALPGTLSHHCLYVSSAGDPTLRPLVERWVRAAPARSDDWEFSATRPRNPDALPNAVEVDGVDVWPMESRVDFEVDTRRSKLDIRLYNPRFVDLDGDAVDRCVYMFLDWALGEDAVERWIGGIETTHIEPEQAITLDVLAETVSAMVEEFAEPRMVLMESTTPAGKPRFIMATAPLQSQNHPLFDRHSQIWLPYEPREDTGLPTDDSLTALREIEDRLVDALEHRAVLLVHESWEGQRLLHFYSDSHDPEARSIIDRVADPAASAIRHSIDPGWRDLSRYK